MTAPPKQWFDAEGHTYSARGGTYFADASGSGIGFDLGPSSAQDMQGAVLANSKQLEFAKVRKAPRKEWLNWPELSSQLAFWRNAKVKQCDSKQCTQTYAKAADLTELDGVATEFTFQDGQKIQHFGANTRASSKRSRKRPIEYASISLWRNLNHKGKVQLLPPNNEDEWLSGITQELEDCETQCGLSWDNTPQVFSIKGRTFAFAPYSGGTVSGYLFVEVTPQAVKRLGWYRWGS
ncbi:hypothetical protein GCM10025770_34190 [Viridibacterium curvum]|uniref:DUF3298 domain-containing protein n=2 Tax=Viridibacterium curvum TaxID=1101404 RepID=A0ABP9R2I4_9RHOO